MKDANKQTHFFIPQKRNSFPFRSGGVSSFPTCKCTKVDQNFRQVKQDSAEAYAAADLGKDELENEIKIFA